nr:aquaporin TIP4-2 [Tanacetum cinerariifolium]GEW52360.1 aquaporin TIP4-2 [Tanacetum cinerariifolium]
MFFYLATLNLARFLKETAPQVEPPKEDDLYNVYCKTTTAKELWESLERKYKIEDICTKKIVHKQKEMSVKDLIVHLCIEEDNKLAQKNTYTPDSAKANMVEHAGSSSKSNSKAKEKGKKKNDEKGKGKAEVVDNEEKMYMGDSVTADIKGEGDVILKMTSEKELKLTNVLYVLEIRKKLVSGWLLNKFGFCLVF